VTSTPRSFPAMVTLAVVCWLLLAYWTADAIASDCRCDDIPLDTAAEMLNLPAADLDVAGHPLPVSPEDRQQHTYRIPPCSCTILSRSDFLESVAYTTYVFKDPGQAHSSLNEMKAGYETVFSVDDLSGIGEVAFLAGGSRFHRLIAMKEGVLVDVLAPKALEIQKQIAGQVLGAHER
jgi:hypothetical protein